MLEVRLSPKVVPNNLMRRATVVVNLLAGHHILLHLDERGQGKVISRSCTNVDVRPGLSSSSRAHSIATIAGSQRLLLTEQNTNYP
jgi:hypothetical protein